MAFIGLTLWGSDDKTSSTAVLGSRCPLLIVLLRRALCEGPADEVGRVAREGEPRAAGGALKGLSTGDDEKQGGWRARDPLTESTVGKEDRDGLQAHTKPPWSDASDP